MRRARFPFLIDACTAKRTPEADALAEIRDGIRGLLEAREAHEREAFFKGLIPVIDGLDALERAIRQAGDPSWMKGAQMLHQKLRAFMAVSGCQAAAEEGALFDPTRHEAVGTQSASIYPPGRIAEVVQDGWLYGGKVLRFAKVLVSKQGE